MITREDVKKVIEQLSNRPFIVGVNMISTDDYYIFKKEDRKDIAEFLKEVHNL